GPGPARAARRTRAPPRDAARVWLLPEPIVVGRGGGDGSGFRCPRRVALEPVRPGDRTAARAGARRLRAGRGDLPDRPLGRSDPRPPGRRPGLADLAAVPLIPVARGSRRQRSDDFRRPPRRAPAPSAAAGRTSTLD